MSRWGGSRWSGAGAGGGAGIGVGFQHLTSLPRTTTTLATPVTKLQLVTGALSGSFLLLWQADVDNNHVSEEGVVQLFNVTDAAILDSKGYGEAGGASHGAIPLPSPERVTGAAVVVLTGSSKTIEVQHYSRLAGNVQGIQNARITAYRVS